LALAFIHILMHQNGYQIGAAISSQISLNRKPLLAGDSCNFENLFDKLHIYILALMRIWQDNDDISFSHVRVLAALMRALKPQTL